MRWTSYPGGLHTVLLQCFLPVCAHALAVTPLGNTRYDRSLQLLQPDALERSEVDGYVVLCLIEHNFLLILERHLL